MIGCTKLLCGTATVSEVLTWQERGKEAPAKVLQFMKNRGPLVVWNVTRRCNLRCEHCYYNSDPQAVGEELTGEEGLTLIADLKAANVPVLLFSGGEPLLREEIYEWGRAANDAGLHVVLSTNGTLISDAVAGRLKASGFAYVGVSLDGLRTTHDRFRGREGAFDEAVAGLCAARGAGVKTGVRFTVTRDNVDDLPGVLDLVEREGIPRFCLYHLVYSGRGSGLTDRDLDHQRRRDLLDFLIRKVLDWKDRGVATEILTVDNHADGVYIADYVRRHLPERIVEVERLQAMHGGCSAGTKFADIDAAGNVHPCQFWEHVTLGNVRERRFAEIWNDTSHPLMKGLKDKPSHLLGERCATCAHVSVCAGCRIRAETVTGDVWGDDPACYLTDEEIRRKSEIPSPKSQTSPKSE